MTGKVDALVVGAGVIGLTTAVHLAENGLLVEVRSASSPDRTSSAAAGAMWNLSFVELCEEVFAWGRETLDSLVALAGRPDTGIRMVDGVEAARCRTEPSGSAQLLPDARPCRPEELPPGFVSGNRFRVPLLDMPIYLEYLCNRLRDAGGVLRIAPVDSLGDCYDHAGIVLNCTGADAAGLTADPALRSVRGQLVVLDNPGVTEFFAEDSDHDDLLYVLPHGDRVVVGGTAESGKRELVSDPVVSKSIIARCAQIVPSLATAAVLDHRVGLRPARRSVRLEVSRRSDGGWLGHCYGHGGAGVSLSWGCAREVLERLKAG